MDRRDTDHAGGRDQPGQRRGPEAVLTTRQHDGHDHHDSDQHQSVRQEDRGAQQHATGQAGQESTSGSAPTDQGQPAHRHAGEQAVRGHGHPDRTREEGDEGHNAPRRAAGPEFTQRDGEGHADRGRDEYAEQPGPEPPAEPDLGQRPEDQRRQGRMGRHVRGPHDAAVDPGTESDEVGERGHKGCRVDDARQIVQVLVGVEQNLGPALRQAVDQSEGAQPGKFSSQPARSRRRQPSTAGPALQVQTHQHAADGQWRTPAKVWMPVRQNRRGRKHDRQPAPEEILADRGGYGDQGEGRGQRDGVRPPPVRGLPLRQPAWLSPRRGLDTIFATAPSSFHRRRRRHPDRRST